MPVLRGCKPPPGGRFRKTIARGAAALAFGVGAVAFWVPAGPASAAPCVRPIAIADRWDDITAIAGYTGGTRKTPNWQRDGVWDHESFTDVNGNLLWDPGEPFVDGNANGLYDAEFYDPLLTGYILDPQPGNVLAPNGDVGRQIPLEPARSNAIGAGRYVLLDVATSGKTAFDCVPSASGATAGSRPTGATLRAIDQGMRALVAADPGASWDLATGQVIGSAFPDGSPRVFLLPAYDPRSFVGGSHGRLAVVKLVPVFLEQVTGKATAIVRVTRVPGGTPSLVIEPCPGAAPGSGAAPMGGAQPRAASWGEMKASYR